jgi:hypothetical protein
MNITMDRKKVTIVLALALIGSFFLPYLQYGPITASGFDLLTAPTISGADKGLLIMKYIWLVIPVAGIMLLIGALNNGNYLLGRGIWAFLPLLTLFFVVALIFRDAKKIGANISISELAKNMGIGFWITLGLSLVLALYWPKRKA